MTFWEYLDALRGVLFKMAVTIAVAAVAMFCMMHRIFDDIVMAPCRGSFPLYGLFDALSALTGDSAGGTADFHVSLINTQLASQFFIHLSLSFQLALVVTFPLLIYELWTFVSPGLYPGE